MAFTISNQAFAEAFGVDKTEETLNKFIEDLKVYLSGKKSISAEHIYDWLKKGGQLDAFTCRQDVVGHMLEELRKRHIPFVLVLAKNGNTGFLIRTSDRAAQKKAAKMVQHKAVSYCKTMTTEDAKAALLKASEKDRTILTVAGLSETEALYIESACSRVLPGDVLGIDRMKDGTYMVCCRGKSAIKELPGSFAALLSEAFLLTSGNSKDTVARSIEETKEYQHEKALGFPDRTGEYNQPVWVVGEGTRFVKAKAEGFELGHAEDFHGEVLLKTDKDVPDTDMNYNKRLNSALANVPGKRCLYREEDVLEYYRERRNYKRDAKQAGERMVISQADEMILRKTKTDKVMHMEGAWDQKMAQYQKEMGRLLAGARDSRIPSGYAGHDIRQLQTTIRAYGLDPSLFTDAIERLTDLEIYAQEPGVDRVEDIEKKIENIRTHEGLELSGQEQEQELEETGQDLGH